MNYKFSTTLNYQGKSYRIRANSTEALKLKKEKKLKELMDSSKVLSPDTSVDKWAETAFNTYKKNVKGLPEIKGRYYKYISPVIGPIPISLVTPVQCQNILNECAGMSFSHVDKLRHMDEIRREIRLEHHGHEMAGFCDLCDRHYGERAGTPAV